MSLCLQVVHVCRDRGELEGVDCRSDGLCVLAAVTLVTLLASCGQRAEQGGGSVVLTGGINITLCWQQSHLSLSLHIMHASGQEGVVGCPWAER